MITEKIVKKILLAVAFSAAFATSAFAQTSSSIPPRDPPFGKGIPDNDSMHQPSATGAIAQTGSSIPPRDPPFGKGTPDNDSMHQPSSAGSGYRDSAADEIPPRDPPFGKGELRNETPHQPVTQGKASDGAGKSELPKSAKKETKTKSALKKDKGGTKQDSAPASDTN